MKTLSGLSRLYLFFHFIFIMNVCAFSQAMTSGTLNVCSGVWYDPGGASANYGNGLNITQTLCSGTVGSCLILTFTSFNTQAGNDLLTIYDGNSTADPLIGTFSGTSLPGVIISSTGCLTITFTSDAATNRAGWAANISCGSCGSIINMTNGSSGTTTACSGIIYDDGGATANHAGSITATRTICSSTAGKCMQLLFAEKSFNSGDSLSIWDGANTSAPLIGHFDGSAALPNIILGTSGCLTIRWKTDANRNDIGFQAIFSCENCPTPPSATATYTSPTIGLQRTYVGNNMVNTCGGTFTDNGGINGNYSNNLNQYYRTFCPSTPRSCLRATFWSVDIQPVQNAFYTDRLYVQDGPTQGSPTIDILWGTATNYQACQRAGFGPYISTDQSGCLTFRFASDATVTQAGWVCTFDCVPCANGPSGTDNNDCRNPTAVCTDVGFSDASTGPGLNSEGGTGCVLSENYSNWYKIVVSSSGTLGLRIVPVTATDDYDFALYQTTDCNSLGSPVRCSYAANTGTTGMDSPLNLTTNTLTCNVANNGADVSEDVCGNGWVDNLNVTLGQTFFLLVNNWSPGGNGFTLDWTLTNNASLNCTILPVELVSFTAEPNGDVIDLAWTTASETNNDYFTVERSKDGINFYPIQQVKGAGTITYERMYLTVDTKPFNGISYYRLKQTDFDGTASYSDVVAVKFKSESAGFQLYPNPAQGSVHLFFTSALSGECLIKVLDLSGREVMRRELALNQQTSETELDVRDLQTGIYYVTLQTPLGISTNRLILK